RPYCLPVFSANEPPLTSDQTAAYFDRWIVVPMGKVIAEANQDPHLRAKLSMPSELEGLLVHAVYGLRRLMDRGHFVLPESVQDGGERYRDRLDSVRAFVSECCMIGNREPKLWIARPVLYRAYKRWSEANGRRPLASTGVFDHLRRTGLTETTRNGSRGFEG